MNPEKMEAKTNLRNHPENLAATAIVANGITQEYGDRVVLDNLSVSMSRQDRVVLVGNNGSGKSTLLEILAGQRQPHQGTITKQAQIAYLPQNHFLFPEETVFTAATRNIPQLAQALEIFEATLDHLDDPQAAINFEAAQEILERHQAYGLKEQIMKQLTEIGLEEINLSTPFEDLSGGERRKIDLVGLFLGKPDFILLDEPTNHLDLETRLWLEKKIKRWPGGLLLVSHDRHLIEKVSQITWEINRGRLQIYGGDYQFYLTQKKIEAEAEERKVITAKKEYQKAKKRRMGHQVINQSKQESQPSDGEKLATKGRRNKTAGRGKEKTQKARQKEIETRKKLAQIRKKVALPQGIRIEVSPEKKTGSLILNLEGVDVPFGNEVGLKQINLKIHQGDHTALFGLNGSGKSSLLKTIRNLSTEQSNLRVQFVDQDYLSLGDTSKTILQIALEQTEREEKALRKHLASFLFRTSDDVAKPMRILSGGEAGRLNLALATARQSDLLILDEPTNNLDLASLKAIEEALVYFKGAIVIVSHDLAFLENIGIHSSFCIINRRLKKLTRNPGEDTFERELLRFFHR